MLKFPLSENQRFTKRNFLSYQDSFFILILLTPSFKEADICIFHHKKTFSAHLLAMLLEFHFKHVLWERDRGITSLAQMLYEIHHCLLIQHIQ